MDGFALTYANTVKPYVAPDKQHQSRKMRKVSVTFPLVSPAAGPLQSYLLGKMAAFKIPGRSEITDSSCEKLGGLEVVSIFTFSRFLGVSFDFENLENASVDPCCIQVCVSGKLRSSSRTYITCQASCDDEYTSVRLDSNNRQSDIFVERRPQHGLSEEMQVSTSATAAEAASFQMSVDKRRIVRKSLLYPGNVGYTPYSN